MVSSCFKYVFLGKRRDYIARDDFSTGYEDQVRGRHIDRCGPVIRHYGDGLLGMI